MNEIVRLLCTALLLAVSFLSLSPSSSMAGEEELVYVSRPGDTLEKVVRVLGVETLKVGELRRYNRLERTRTLPPGTKIRFRLGWLKVKPETVRVEAVSGSASVVRAGKKGSEKVRAGFSFKPGDTLETGENGSVLLHFGDGSKLLVQGDSSLMFEVLEKYGDPDIPNIRLWLYRGRIETQVAPHESPNRRFQIRTPAGSAGARGTRFRVASEEGSGRLLTEVTHGEVAVIGGGQDRAVAEHFGTYVAPGKVPADPQPLLPPPEFLAAETLYRRLPLLLRWEGPEGAKGYRVQVVSAAQEGVILFERVVSEGSVTIKELENGEYRIVVRAIDGHGLEGLDAYHAFTLDAYPLPPLLEEPGNGARVFAEEPVFRWAASPDARRYHFQLAADAGFDQILVDRKLTELQYQPRQPLAPGSYYWRVASQDGNGDWGVFSEPRHFFFSPPPPPPRLLEIRKTRGDLFVSWRGVERGHRYQLQLSPDPSFSKAVLQYETADREMRLSRPARRIYLRIRTLDGEGQAGPFGEAVEVVPPMGWSAPLMVLGGVLLLLIL